MIGVPLLNGKGYTKETIRVEYEWKPPRCATCQIFGHTCDQCPRKVTTPPNVVGKDDDGFQTVGTKRTSGKNSAPKGGTKVGQKFVYKPKGTINTDKVVPNSSNVSNQQVPSKSTSSTTNASNSAPNSNIPNANVPNASKVNSEPSSSNANVPNSSKVNFGPRQKGIQVVQEKIVWLRNQVSHLLTLLMLLMRSWMSLLMF